MAATVMTMAGPGGPSTLPFGLGPPSAGAGGRTSCSRRHERKKSLLRRGELCQPALPAHLLPLSATKLSPLLTPVRVFLDVYCPTGKPPALWGYFN